MITIEKYGNDKIVLHGHTLPDVCAACSSIMYTAINFIDRYDKDASEFIDDTEKDIVTIIIKKHDETIDMILDTMFDMFNDLRETDNQDKIQIKNMEL